MGTWDVGSFDNDAAVDWTYGLEGSKNFEYVESAIDAVLNAGPDDDVDADDGVNAIVAADVVARLLGNWGESSSYSETADNWVRANPIAPPRALVQKAVRALDRVTTAPSELLELWEESGDADGWKIAVAEVRGRLGGS